MGYTHITALSVATSANGPHNLEVAGSAQVGGTVRFGGAAVISGAQTFTGNATFAGKIAMSNGSTSGVRAIATGGSSSIANKAVRSSSRLFLTGQGNAANYKHVCAFIGTIASGISFKVRLQRIQTTGTVASANGTVRWFMFNTA